MRIETADFVAGAQSARGLAVVIDVFRAFSIAAYAFARGARTIVPVADLAEARQLKHLHPDWLLIGERHGRPLLGLDCGNSPTELERLDLCDRTLIHTTHSGTQGLTAALSADEAITGSLVNAGAIVRYIRSRAPASVTREELLGAPSAQKFFDPACDWAPERDFELCTQLDAFDFVLRLEQGDEPAQLRRSDVPRNFPRPTGADRSVIP